MSDKDFLDEIIKESAQRNPEFPQLVAAAEGGRVSIDEMTPREAYEEGYRNGESSLVADIDTLCDQLGIEYEGNPITAVRNEIVRLNSERGQYRQAALELHAAIRSAFDWIAAGAEPSVAHAALKREADRWLLTLEASVTETACSNCDGRRCMGCVFREYDHDCADDCPECCADANEARRVHLAAEAAVRHEEAVERGAHELYAAGPWGKPFQFVNEGAHLITDAHSMKVYREMVRLVLDTVNKNWTQGENG